MSSINVSKKNDLLIYIESYIKNNGYPPSLSEMCRDVGFSTKSLVSHYLDLLVADGKIIRTPKISRGIKLVKDTITGYTPPVEKPLLAIYPEDTQYHDLFSRKCPCGVEVEETDKYIIYKHCRFDPAWIVAILDKIGGQYGD